MSGPAERTPRAVPRRWHPHRLPSAVECCRRLSISKAAAGGPGTYPIQLPARLVISSVVHELAGVAICRGGEAGGLAWAGRRKPAIGKADNGILPSFHARLQGNGSRVEYAAGVAAGMGVTDTETAP